MAPAVTIIVPTYNRPRLLGEAIRSALAQTYQDWVMLVGDNGGSPENEGVVASFGDPRIRYVRHPDGLGPQGNWLELVRLAETPLIASLHDDDSWRPGFLEKAVPPLLDDPSLSMVFTDYWVIDGDGALWRDMTEDLSHRTHRDRIPAGRWTGSRPDTLRLVAVWNAAQPAYAGVVRRSAIVTSDFPDDIAPIYDLWLTFQIMMRGEGLYYVPERLTNNRVWGGSLTSSDPIKAEDTVFRWITEEAADLHPAVDEVQRRWAELRYGRAGRLMSVPDGKDRSRHELREAAPHLDGVRRLIATVGGRSAIGWDSLRVGRRIAQRGPARVRAWMKDRNAPIADGAAT